MGIEAAFDGRIGGPQIVRTSAKGNRWVSISVAVVTGEENPEWISVACFGDVMDELPNDLAKGERIYVEGKLKISRYTDKHGEQRASLQLSASRIIVLDRIGRRRSITRAHPMTTFRSLQRMRHEPAWQHCGGRQRGAWAEHPEDDASL